MRTIQCTCAGVLLALVTTASYGGPVVFDFEDAPLSTGAGPDLFSYTATRGGLTITLTRGIQPFGFFDLSDVPGTEDLGQRTLHNRNERMSSPYLMVFSQPVEQVTLTGGTNDGGPSRLELFALPQIVTPLGQELGRDEERFFNGAGESFLSRELSFDADGPYIKAISFSGGTGNSNDVFFDNVAVVIPLPPAVLTAPLMLPLAIGLSRRFLRR